MPGKNGANTIHPSGPQAPPFASGVSHSVTGAPPDNAIFFNFASAKNATHSPSGEKNGL